jgi:hypothetical protein
LSQLASLVELVKELQNRFGEVNSALGFGSSCGLVESDSDTDRELLSTMFSGANSEMPEREPLHPSMRVVDCPQLFHRLGGARRHHCPGPESELVDWFLEECPFRIPRGCRATLFREPRLMSGFPDLVLVYWSERAIEQWNEDRAHLRDSELRLLHYLVQHGHSSKENIEKVFSTDVDERLDRLQAAGLLRRVGNGWKPRALSKCYAVREIIAIEAKMSDWTTVLQQAYLNTWFASQSYILVPNIPRGARFLDQAASLNIGVWSRLEGCQIKPSPVSSQLPISYASWLFNEWVWKAEGFLREHV